MDAVAALRAGLPVLLPTDTVYGLAQRRRRGGRAARLYELKGRAREQPTAILAATRRRAARRRCRSSRRDRCATLLPGRSRSSLAEPRAAASRGSTGGAPGRSACACRACRRRRAQVVDAVGVVARDERERSGRPEPGRRSTTSRGGSATAAAPSSTSARCPGRRRPCIDLTGDEPRILREGAVPASATPSRRLARIGSASWPSRSRRSRSFAPRASPRSTRRSPSCSAASSSGSAARSS